MDEAVDFGTCKKTIDSWVKGSGLDISEEHYTKCNDCIGNMLAGKKCLTREEIETELERRGILVWYLSFN